MGLFFNDLIVTPLKRFFSNTFSQIAEINKKYAQPHIKTTKAVRFSLFMLRLYLIFLLGILFYKFFTTVVK